MKIFNNKKVLLVLLIIFFITFVLSSIKIILYMTDNGEVINIVEHTNEHIKVEDDKVNIFVDFDALSKENKDTVAYLKVNNTNIDYIVVKGKNNSYYLTHNFKKKWSNAGWVFADYRNNFDDNDKNIIVYGHNMRSGSMFGTLKNVLKKEWYLDDDNRKITFVTKSGTYYYDIFSIYTIKSEEYYITTDFSDINFLEFVNKIKSRSIYDFNVDVDESDNILTLSTCTTGGKKRVVVHAKRIEN